MMAAINERVIMGSNSASYGEALREASAPTVPEKKGRFPYFKFYPRDWIEATRHMTLEQRGAYIDMICLLMEMEGHLADNDAWIAHQMHISTRKWRAMKGQLLDQRKLRLDDGFIVNDRCLRELDVLLAQRRNLAESASNRERTKRESASNQHRTKRENSEKPNQNNTTTTTVVPLRARVLDSDSDIRDSDPYGSGAAAPPPGDRSASPDAPRPPAKDPAPSQSDLPLLPDEPTSQPSVPDAKDILWRDGLNWLARVSGKRQDSLRSLIGRWLKEVSPAELLDFMRAAAKARTADPVGYIGGIVEQHARTARSVRRENGRLLVMNDFKAELEQILAGRDLQRALDQIAGKIPIGVSGLDLEARVRGLAVEMVERTADQDRRYAAAAAQNVREGPPRSHADQRQQSANDWLYADLDRRERKGPAQPRLEEHEW